MCIWFSKVNAIFFSAVPTLLLIPSVGPFPNSKSYFLDYQYEMMNYYQHKKLKHF